MILTVKSTDSSFVKQEKLSDFNKQSFVMENNTHTFYKLSRKRYSALLMSIKDDNVIYLKSFYKNI